MPASDPVSLAPAGAIIQPDVGAGALALGFVVGADDAEGGFALLEPIGIDAAFAVFERTGR